MVAQVKTSKTLSIAAASRQMLSKPHSEKKPADDEQSTVAPSNKQASTASDAEDTDWESASALSGEDGKELERLRAELCPSDVECAGGSDEDDVETTSTTRHLQRRLQCLHSVPSITTAHHTADEDFMASASLLSLVQTQSCRKSRRRLPCFKSVL